MISKEEKVQQEVDVVLEWMKDEKTTRFGEAYFGAVFVYNVETLYDIFSLPLNCKKNNQRRTMTFEDGSVISFTHVHTLSKQETQAHNYAGTGLTSVCFTAEAYHKTSKYLMNFLLTRLRSPCSARSRFFII